MASPTFERIRLHATHAVARTDSVWLFGFAPNVPGQLGEISYEPGQVAILSVPDCGEAYMAIASSPESRATIEFLVKRSGEVGERLYELGENATVDLIGLVGSGFPVDEFEGKDLVFVAAGTAIAPVRSALIYIVGRRASFGRVVLIHGVRHPEDLSVDDELDHWREADVDVLLTVTRPDDAWAGHTGRVQALLDTTIRDTLDPVVFVCGSDEMMADTRSHLIALGIDNDQIIQNY